MDSDDTSSDEILEYLALLEEIDGKSRNKRVQQDGSELNMVYTGPISFFHS